MGTYAVGDIHGCFDEWMKLKDFIEGTDRNARFILTGDIVDRGPKVVEMLRWAVENIKPGGKYQMVLGNHEYEKMKWWNSYKSYEKRMVEGCEDLSTAELLASFAADRYDYKSKLCSAGVSAKEIQRFHEFMEKLPLQIETTVKRKGVDVRYVVTHAAYMPEELLQPSKTMKAEHINICKEGLLYERHYGGYHSNLGVIVVHGHTPTIFYSQLGWQIEEPGRIAYSLNDINVDCGATYNKRSSRLAAVRLEDHKEVYLKDGRIEVRYGKAI